MLMLCLCRACVKWERGWNKHKAVNHDHWRPAMIALCLCLVLCLRLSLIIMLVLMRKWKPALNEARVKHHTSHDPNPIQAHVKFGVGPNWCRLIFFGLLRRFACLASCEWRLKTDFRSNTDLHMSRYKQNFCSNGAILTLSWKVDDHQERLCNLFGVMV